MQIMNYNYSFQSSQQAADAGAPGKVSCKKVLTQKWSLCVLNSLSVISLVLRWSHSQGSAWKNAFLIFRQF